MKPELQRVHGASLDVDEVLGVYRASGLGRRRPIHDRERFAAMLANANLVVTARLDRELIGIARSVSDFVYATYLSDVAVVERCQRAGVGRALIAATQAEAPTAKIILLSAPAATRYYPHIGFKAHESAWVLEAGVSPARTQDAHR